MACVTICTTIVNEESIESTLGIECTPRHEVQDSGNEAYVVIPGAEAKFDDPGPRIEYSYAISIEYQWELGMDYCFIEGTDTVSLPDGTESCSCTEIISSYTPTLLNIVFDSTNITADLSITWNINSCTNTFLNIQLCEV